MAAEPTLPLNEFLAKYRQNDNEWWYLTSGDHMNLFDEAVDHLEEAAEALRDIVNASRDDGLAHMCNWMRGRAIEALKHL